MRKIIISTKTLLKHDRFVITIHIIYRRCFGQKLEPIIQFNSLINLPIVEWLEGQVVFVRTRVSFLKGKYCL